MVFKSCMWKSRDVCESCVRQSCVCVWHGRMAKLCVWERERTLPGLASSPLRVLLLQLLAARCPSGVCAASVLPTSMSTPCMLGDDVLATSSWCPAIAALTLCEQPARIASTLQWKSPNGWNAISSWCHWNTYSHYENFYSTPGCSWMPDHTWPAWPAHILCLQNSFQAPTISINMQSTDMETLLVFHRSYNPIQSHIYGCFQGHNFGLRGYVWSTPNFHGWLESDLGGWLPMLRTCLQRHGVYINIYIHIHVCIYHICILNRYIYVYIYIQYTYYIYIYNTKTQLIMIQKKHFYSWLVRPTNTTFGATNMGIWPWTIAEMTCDWLLLSSFYTYI